MNIIGIKVTLIFAIAVINPNEEWRHVTMTITIQRTTDLFVLNAPS